MEEDGAKHGSKRGPCALMCLKIREIFRRMFTKIRPFEGFKAKPGSYFWWCDVGRTLSGSSGLSGSEALRDHAQSMLSEDKLIAILKWVPMIVSGRGCRSDFDTAA